MFRVSDLLGDKYFYSTFMSCLITWQEAGNLSWQVDGSGRGCCIVKYFAWCGFLRSIRPFVRNSFFPSVVLSVHQSVTLSVHRSVCPSVRRSICPSVRRSVCLSVRRSVCPPVRRSFYPSVRASVANTSFLSFLLRHSTLQMHLCIFARTYKYLCCIFGENVLKKY